MEAIIMILSLLGKIFLVIGLIGTLIHIGGFLFDVIQTAFTKTEEKVNGWKIDLRTIPFILVGIFGALILIITKLQ
jgi:uncharacterized membrane protein YphA (DoxX/SURF4 family)